MLSPFNWTCLRPLRSVEEAMKEDDGRLASGRDSDPDSDRASWGPLAETVERLRGISRKIGLDQDIVKKLTALRHEHGPHSAERSEYRQGHA